MFPSMVCVHAVLGQAQKDLLDEEKRESVLLVLNMARGEKPSDNQPCHSPGALLNV